ncbi:MAG: Panacea domain-containing protein, partial [Prochlorothrix sp.]
EATITQMKVQKLLYYSQSLHLALFDVPLFSEPIQAWCHGPVCPPVYHLYRQLQDEQLPMPPKDTVFKSLTAEVQMTLDEVWDYFGIHDAYTLSDMTHQEFPWQNARQKLTVTANSGAEISLEDMKLLGEQKLEEIEQAHPAYSPILSQVLSEAMQPNAAPQYIEAEDIHDWITTLLT